MKISKAQKKAYENAKAKGFHSVKENQNFGSLLMHIAAELGETWESYRYKGFLDKDTITTYKNLNKDNFNPESFKLHIKDSIEDELSDIVIRILDLCGVYGIDLEWHIKEKMKYNETREHLHGKKF